MAAGDIACHAREQPTAHTCRQAYTAELVKRLHPDVVATLGDAHQGHGTLANLVGSYDPTWGAFRRITRPALGNHEYLPVPGGGERAATLPISASARGHAAATTPTG